jgi:hypothetical protein
MLSHWKCLKDAHLKLDENEEDIRTEHVKKPTPLDIIILK